jgi:hypothetical protein
MWPRTIEVTLGAWMVIAPLVFRDTEDIGRFAANAVISGGLVILASLAAFWRPAGAARFATLGVGLWLMVHGYFAAPRPGPPAAQNEITIGLLLLVFAILPNEVNDPPVPWRRGRA